MDSGKGLQLNPGQVKAISSLMDFVFESSDQFFCLKGFAGTGKTFAIQRFIQKLPRGTRCVVTAPTNKATSVLKGFGAAAGLNIPALTTYSLFGLVLDSSNEIRECRANERHKAYMFDVIIVDECSMVGRKLCEIILERLEPHQKLIYMGDPYQLNPVNEGVSQTFHTPMQATLDQVMRQEEGSPILEVVRDVRTQCITGELPPPFQPQEDENGDGTHLVLGRDFTDLAAAQFNLDTLEADAAENRYLAWTNKAVLAFNKKVRQRLYGTNPPEFVPGETVAILTPVFDAEDELVFHTDDEGVILAVDEGTITDYLDKERREYEVWQLHIAGNDKEGVVNVLKRRANAKYQKRLQELATQARQGRTTWSTFWAFKELFCEARHVYGMTVHRAQGQTIKNVFVDVANLFKNDDQMELKRLLYVATSRASENLVLNRKMLRVEDYVPD